MMLVFNHTASMHYLLLKDFLLTKKEKIQ